MESEIRGNLNQSFPQGLKSLNVKTLLQRNLFQHDAAFMAILGTM